MIFNKIFLIVFFLFITKTYSMTLSQEQTTTSQPLKNKNDNDNLRYSNIYISVHNCYGKLNDCTDNTNQNESNTSKNTKSLDNYEYEENLGYYKYYKGPARWHDALKRCEKDNAHLIILNSYEEADFLHKLVNSKPKVETPWHGFTHIGFHDQIVEGQFITIKNEPLCLSGYWKWAPGQPDNHNKNENCGSIFKTGGLNDLACVAEADFVCERDL